MSEQKGHSGHHFDTKRHCQVCDKRLPFKSRTTHKYELCLRHSCAVTSLIHFRKVSVEKVVQLLRSFWRRRLQFEF